MKSFKDLEAWQIASKPVDEIYKITKEFPSSELYGLTSQLRRSSTSITGNIAEGFGRFTYKDKANRYVIARGECNEIQSHLETAIRVGIISKESCEEAFKLVTSTGRLLSGLINASYKRS